MPFSFLWWEQSWEFIFPHYLGNALLNIPCYAPEITGFPLWLRRIQTLLGLLSSLRAALFRCGSSQTQMCFSHRLRTCWLPPATWNLLFHTGTLCTLLLSALGPDNSHHTGPPSPSSFVSSQRRRPGSTQFPCPQGSLEGPLQAGSCAPCRARHSCFLSLRSAVLP